MILIEMKLAGELDFATVMINMAHVSEVSEMSDSVHMTMVSGNTYHVTTETFHAAIGSIEGLNYLKFKQPDADDAEVVEDADYVVSEDTVAVE
ncbi:MAG: hypothetical protein ACRC6V_12200 [Bacteroidales bacterium]